MLSRSEAVEVAQKLIDYKSRGYVADGLDLARFVVYMFGDGALAHEANNLTAVQARCTELLEQVRCLRGRIEELHHVSEAERVRLIDELHTIVLAMR